MPNAVHPAPSTSPPAAGPSAADSAGSGAAAAAARALSRRGFLRAAAVTGGGLVVASIAACAPTATPPGLTYGPSLAPDGSGAVPPPSAAASPAASMDHGTPAPGATAGPTAHDAKALEAVQRFLGGESAAVEGLGGQPYGEPRVEDGVKVFELTIDEIKHRIDARKDPLEALGYNGMWPGPRIDVIEGDRIRAVFTNNLKETTGVHFHGQRLPNAMDGVPHVTQDPIEPGASFAYEFTVRTPGSHMYHSHHNATDQVGRGLLGAFIVHPRDEAQRVEQLYGVGQDIVWISNDSLGGFTINGRGFPATAPIVATLGEKILIRFMNEGSMMHPWHVHGMPMRIVARDGYPLGAAAFTCDTLGVNPGERWDAVIDCDEPGAWAFHCHILPHAEGMDGMFGMVTALVVQEPGTAAARSNDDVAGGEPGPIRSAAFAAGSTALLCRIS